jgi:hypothetical protein
MDWFHAFQPGHGLKEVTLDQEPVYETMDQGVALNQSLILAITRMMSVSVMMPIM